MAQFNFNLQNGIPQTSSKVLDFIPKITIALHLLEKAARELLPGHVVNEVVLEDQASEGTLRNATLFAHPIVEQKGICETFIKELEGNEETTNFAQPINNVT